MRNSKFLMLAIAAALLSGGIILKSNALAAETTQHQHAAPAAAKTDAAGHGQHGKDGGMAKCPGMSKMGAHGKGMTLTPEQRKQVNAVVQESHAKMQPLRDQIFVKREELRAMQQATNPDVTAVGKKAQEINVLREQLRKERMALGEKLDKALGLPEGTHNMGGGHMSGHMGGGQMGEGHGQHPGGGKMGGCN